jgi:hypothetical protein
VTNEVAHLAAKIANGNAEPWLVNGLRRGVSALQFAFAQEVRQPSRPVLRKEINTGIKAIQRLLEIMDNSAIARALADSAGEDLDADRTLFHSLSTLRDRLEAVSSAIPFGQGRQIHDPGSRTAVEICSLVIAYAWQRARSQAIPHTSAAAMQACRELWQLATGEPIPAGWGCKATGWLPNLRKAKEELAKDNIDVLMSWFQG